MRHSCGSFIRKSQNYMIGATSLIWSVNYNVVLMPFCIIYAGKPFKTQEKYASNICFVLF